MFKLPDLFLEGARSESPTLVVTPKLLSMEKRILVAPLNWGLGHATRCIPTITALTAKGFTPIIASDGQALALLRKEFPELTYFELPTYNISYTKNGLFLKWKLLMQLPKILRTIKQETKAVSKILKDHTISGIISDNRWGVRHNRIPCVFISHQLQILSGNTTWFSTKMHKSIIKKFDICWVPDMEGTINLSGKLGHIKRFNMPLKYIGPLSRFTKLKSEIKYSLMVLLSGPEPQRGRLEKKLLFELQNYTGNVIFIRGIIEDKQTISVKKHITIYNFMTSCNLEKAINASDLILSRSGYTTVMDLAKLEKKVYFIPTPGQFEQEYLAKRLTKMGLAPSCKQKDFTLEKLNSIENYKGLKRFNPEVDYEDLFCLF